MLSSIGVWTSHQNQLTVTATDWIALDSNYTSDINNAGDPVAGLTTMVITVKDSAGVSQLRPLSNVKKGDQFRVTIDPDADVDPNLSWQIGVSGDPTYYEDADFPYFSFPVSSAGRASVTRDGEPALEFAWTPRNSLITVEAPAWSAGGTRPSVYYTNDSTITSTWDSSAFESRSRRWPTREGDVRKVIYQMTRAKDNISFIYRESLRSMIASFNDVGYISSEDKWTDVKCIHANAERAIAKLKQENNIILPILSIGQTVSDNDTTRQKTESLLVNEKYWDSDKQKAIRVLSLAPRAVNIRYQINLWCKYMSDMDQILEQIRLKFNPEMQVPTEFSTLAKAYMDSEEDVGSVTGADKEDRILKKTMNVVLRTYIPSPKFLYTSTGKIEEFKVETK